MSGQKICYIVQNPLECLSQARDLVYKNEGKRCVVVLPRHIEPFVLEAYLLENKKAVSGVEIHKISSLARNMMSKISVGQRLKRVDQVALSEHFESDYTRGITRTLLNSVLELRQSYFDIGYLESLFASKVGAEYPMLLKVFKKYEDFLKAEGLSDDADFNRAFVDVLSDPVRSSIIPSDTVVLFAGFTEYTSTDLALIAAVSKNVDECYMVGPDLFIDGLDYSRVLKESLASMDFDIQKIEGSRNAGIKLFELKSPTEEVCHISNSIPDGVKASIYTSSDLDIYYSLFKYFMHDKVSVRSSVRLDRSKILSVLLGLIKLKGTDWEYRDIYRLMSYQNLWNDHVQIRKLMSFIAERGLFPSDKDYFVQLEAKQVVDLINAVAETIPAKAKPLAYVSAINELINKLNLREKLSVSDKFELSTVENLIYRVTSALDNNKELNTEEFCRKLSVHAEENYLVRGLPYFTDVTLSASRLISSNTTENVWFVGMNQEKARSNAAEDLIIKDSFILSLRAENFIRPTSRESRALEDKMICDAVKGSNVTYVSNMGDPLDCLKGLEKEEVNTKVPICSGYFADLANTATIIKDHQSKSVSPTAIETYIECPYRYFASKVIKVERSEADELTPSASIQGQIAHEALEKLLPVYLKDTKIDIHSEIEKIITGYENDLKLTRSPSNKVWANRISLIIETVLKGEQEFFKRNPFLEIFKTEQKLNCYVELKDGKINFTLNPPAANSPSSTVAFYGKTDRIDVNKRDNAFYIIDYKKSITPKKPEIEDGRKVQLLLYMAAASLIFPEIKAGGGCYISLSKASTGDNPKSWRLIIGNIDDGICPPRSKTGRSCITLNEGTFYEDIAGILAKKAVGALKGITEGIFSIDPVQDISSDEEDEYSSSTEREICGICDYKRCCGVKYWY